MITTYMITLFSLGILGGIFSGLLGIGGGIIMVPLLIYIPNLLGFNSLSIKIIVGITMVQSLAGSLSALIIHRRNSLVHRTLVIYVGISCVIGSLIGSIWSAKISGFIITIIFAIIALLASCLLLLPIHREDEDKKIEDVVFNKTKVVIIGLVVGLLGGILGQGGAFLLIPLMIYFIGVPTRITLGSSAAISFISALSGLFGKWSTNQIPFKLALTVALGAVIGAQVGGYLSKRIPVYYLRNILIVIIAGTGLEMSYSVITQKNSYYSMYFFIGIALVGLGFFYLYKRSRYEEVSYFKENTSEQKELDF